MTAHQHAIVWIDHHKARIISFNADEADERTIRPAHPTPHLHHQSGSPAGTHAHADAEYFRSIVEALKATGEILVAGPSTAKIEFLTWMRSHAPGTVERLCGVETLPEMSDGQLLAEARHYFQRADRMRPQLP